MKPEKMTTEALVGIRQRMESGETMTAGEQRAVLAFIAALEAERDEVRAHLAEANATKGDMLRGVSKDTATVLNLAGSLGCGPDDVWQAMTELRRRAEEGEALNTTQERELDALRERVSALEVDRDTAVSRANKAELTIAAFRQRAGDGVVLARLARTAVGAPAASLANSWREMTTLAQQQWVNASLAVARYILGEDGADISPPATVEEARAELEAAGVDVPAFLDRRREAVRRARPASPAPTTAEAFATVREGGAGAAPCCLHPKHWPQACAACGCIGAGDPSAALPKPTNAEAFARIREYLDESGAPETEWDSSEPLSALSLLERRMGALARALDKIVSVAQTFNHAEACEVEDEYDGDEVEGCRCFLRHLPEARAALTDAPPGFTLEEVETVVRGALTDSGEWAQVVGIVMGAIRERLHALRR
jgi:hypothetical protein